MQSVKTSNYDTAAIASCHDISEEKMAASYCLSLLLDPSNAAFHFSLNVHSDFPVHYVSILIFFFTVVRVLIIIYHISGNGFGFHFTDFLFVGFEPLIC